MKKHFLFLSILLICTSTTTAQTTWQVGPGRIYTAPSQVINQVSDGDIVEIDAGEYIGDVGAWYTDNLTIRGVGGMAHIRANGNNSQGKAIWVIGGDNYVIENIELSECTVPDENGAGIRQEGTNLTVRNCYFHDNENGILAGDNANSHILVEYSEFARNSHPSGQAHNLYVNHIQKFTLRHSYFHGAVGGHNLKSRAAENHILYNRIMDESNGSSSYIIDIPDGGKAYVLGNILQQGQNAENSTVISYGRENATYYSSNEFNFYNNTLVDERFNGYYFGFDNNISPSVVRIFNNIFAGEVTAISTGSVTVDMNQNQYYPTIADAGLMDVQNYDYRLMNGSLAINAGIDPATQAVEIPVDLHYIHPMSQEARPTNGTIDMGAYEFGMSTSLATQELAFSTKLVNAMVQLDWSVHTAKVVKLFEIEKAVLGDYFEKIADIPTHSARHYQFQDKTISEDETYYYRLKIVFEDEEYLYSDVATIHINATKKLTVFPNPTRDVLSLSGIDAVKGNVRLLNAQGRLIKQFSLKGQEREQLDLSDMEAGLYYLEWDNMGQKEVHKIILK